MSEKFRINVSASSSSDSAAVPSSSAKRTRQSSLAKKRKRRTDDTSEIELNEPPQTSCAASQAEDALSSLPPELLAIIIRKLDTTSISKLHNTCRHLRNVVHTPGVVKELNLSLSTLATVKSKLDIFHDISGHVRVLNLSGVYDLDLPALVRALEHMESLVDLDVSYTNVTMPDFLKFSKVRPTLQSLAINFDLDGRCQVSEEYQTAFEGFRTVHFVCPRKHQSLYRVVKAAILMLLKADLFRLTLTFVCIDLYMEETIDWNVKGALRVAQFQMHFLQDPSLAILKFFGFIEFVKYEIIIFIRLYGSNTKVLATPLVKKVIYDRFAIEVGNLPESTFTLKNQLDEKRSEICLMLWHRERHRFDEEFRAQLSSIFKEYYVFSVRSDALTQIPPGFKWHELTHTVSSAPSSLELDYGEVFKEERDIKLHLHCYSNFDIFGERKFEPVRMINNYGFLKKISHLSLSVSGYSPYDSDFFSHVFEHCESLVTFQINLRLTHDPMSLRPIIKNKSIKNIYIEGDASGLRPIVSYLSECRTLERFVYWASFDYVKSLPDPSELFKKCGNLYYICVLGEIYFYSRVDRDDLLTLYEEVKSTLGRDALTIDIIHVDRHQYTPYMNVFNVTQLKPLNQLPL